MRLTVLFHHRTYVVGKCVCVRREVLWLEGDPTNMAFCVVISLTKNKNWRRRRTTLSMDSRFCDAVNERPRKKVRKINDRLRVFDYKTQSFVRDGARTSQTPWQMFTFVFFLFLRGESGEKHNKFQSWIFRKVSTDKREASERIEMKCWKVCRCLFSLIAHKTNCDSRNKRTRQR